MKKSQLRNIIREVIREQLNSDREPIYKKEYAKYPTYLSAPCDCLTPEASSTSFPYYQYQNNCAPKYPQTSVYGSIDNPHPNPNIDCYIMSSGGQINGQNAQIGMMFLYDGGFGDGRCHKVLAVCNPKQCNPNVNIPRGQNNACSPGKNPCNCPTDSGPVDPVDDAPLKMKSTSGGRGELRFIDNTR